MTDYPKVSIVTITYGHENYITQTLDGVLMQNYPGEIEFIIANDNSPDNTDEVVNSYFSSKNLPTNFSIKYTKHEVNKGMMPNFIWALGQASGKYIALCEGDDYWTDPAKLQKQVGFLEENDDFNICFHSVSQLNETRNEMFEFNLNKSKTLVTELKNLCESNYIQTPSVLLRKLPTYPAFLEDVYPGDWALYIVTIGKGKIRFLDENMAFYRIHYGGVHSTKNGSEYSVTFLNTMTLLRNYLFSKRFYTESKILSKRINSNLGINNGIYNRDKVNLYTRCYYYLFYVPLKTKIYFIINGKRKLN